MLPPLADLKVDPRAPRPVLPPLVNRPTEFLEEPTPLATIGVADLVLLAYVHDAETFRWLERLTAIALLDLVITSRWRRSPRALARGTMTHFPSLAGAAT